MFSFILPIALDAKVQLRFIYNLPICEMNGVGLELGISPHTLSVIQKNNSMDVIAQKREILSQWLRQDIRASYKRLAEVLQKHDPPEMKSIEKLAMNLGQFFVCFHSFLIHVCVYVFVCVCVCVCVCVWFVCIQQGAVWML